MNRFILAAAAALALTSLAPAYAGEATAAHSHHAGQDVEANKKNARAVIETMWHKRDPEAAAKLLAPDYVEHMAFASTPGVQGFVEGAKMLLGKFPNINANIVKLIGEGDMVVAFVHWKSSPEAAGDATADFFRFNADGKLAEHWNVTQPVPTGEAARNPLSMF